MEEFVLPKDFEEKMKTLIAEDPVFPAMKADRV